MGLGSDTWGLTSCPRCRTPSRDGARFCLQCGMSLRGGCLKCGEGLAEGVRFCGSCGTPVQGLSVLDSTGATAEFKQATVLFADIVSSTRLIAAMDAEETMQFLSPVVMSMVDTVRRYEGTIGRTLGDGVMALFGAPLAHEGHALLACEAALALHEAAAGFAGIQLRVGLHSGEVVVHGGARGIERELSLHGVVIHLASRIVGMAEPGTAYLSDATVALASAYATEFVDARMASGFDQPVRVHRLVGPKAFATAATASPIAASERAALRGREPEHDRLRGMLACVVGGIPRIVGVVGAAGVGKTRLCEEFVRECHQQGVRVYVTRAQLYGHATPLKPVLDFLRSVVLNVTPADDAATVRQRIAEQVRGIEGNSAQDQALLNEFLGVAESEDGTSALGLQSRLRVLVAALVRQMLKDGPAVVVIEDLHWLDAASADFLGTLIDAVAGTRLLLMLNYRPGFSASWMRSASFSEIVLGDLHQADMVQLVQDLIGPAADTRDLAVRIARRSGGNPFFAEEIVRALTADGTLVRHPSRLALGEKDHETPLPSTVQAVIGARIDQLSEPNKFLLQLCAILGKDFQVSVLRRILDLGSSELQHRLDELCVAEFLSVSHSGARDHMAFRHPLIQEVAYRTQLKKRRAPLHAMVARALVSFEDHFGDEGAGLISYHYEAAGQTLEAAIFGARAASWVSATDTLQAIALWEKVRQLMVDQPDTPELNVLRSRANSQIAWLGWRQGLTLEQAKPLIHEALNWARRDDQRMIPMLMFLEGRIHIANGGAADYYVERVRQALGLPGGHDTAGRRATLNVALSHALGWAGLLDAALEANDNALVEVGAVEPSDEQFLGYRVEDWAQSLRGRLQVRMARFDEALACFGRILAADARDHDPTVRFIAHMGSMEVAAARCDPDAAFGHAVEVGAIARQHPNPYLQVFALAAEGVSAMVAGQANRALGPFRNSLELLRHSRVAQEYETELLVSLAECLCRMGEREQAVRAANEALAMARSRTARLPQCRAHLLLAELSMASECRGDQEWADHLAHAEQLIVRTGAAIYSAQLSALRMRGGSGESLGT